MEVASSLANGTQLSNSATLKDSSTNSVSATAVATVQSIAVLSISQIDFDPDPVAPGAQLAVTVSGANTSTESDAPNATMTVTLPSNTTFVSASDDGTVGTAGIIVTFPLGDLVAGANVNRELVVEVDSSLATGTQLTFQASMQDDDGASASGSDTVTVEGEAVGAEENTGGGVVSTSVTTVVSPTITTVPAADTTQAAEGEGLPEPVGVAGGGSIISSSRDRERDRFVRESTVRGTVGGPSPAVPEARPRPEGAPEKPERPTGCANVLSFGVSYSPRPAIAGKQVTYTITFFNSSDRQRAKGVVLRNTLPQEMRFVSASDDGLEDNNVVTWDLGDMLPGAIGFRTVTAEVGIPETTATLFVNDKVVLSDRSGVCARTDRVTTVERRSDEPEPSPEGPQELTVEGQTSPGEESGTGGESESGDQEARQRGDDDRDGFPNQTEMACGSDPRDPTSTCYSVQVSSGGGSVSQGGRVTFTATLQGNFDFQGPVTFSAPRGIPGGMWSFSRTTAVLSSTQRSARSAVTIQTTKATPTGVHRVTIRVSSGPMISEKTFSLEVRPNGSQVPR